MKRVLLFIISGIFCLNAAGNTNDVIWYSKNSKGNPTWSDQHQNGASEYKPGTKNNIVSTVHRSTTTKSHQISTIAQPSQTITILYPTNEQSIRKNNGNIAVRVSLETPSYNANQIKLTLDGKAVSSKLPARQTTFNLNNIDRGEHTIVATLISESGKVIAVSKPVTFYLLRHSIITPN